MMTSKEGCLALSSTTFCEERFFASSSPRVTDSIEPIKSDKVGFLIRFSSVLPCAVAMSITPRSAMVLQAAASSSVPTSSTTITCGVWF